MSGIAAIFRADGGPVAAGLIEAMTAAMDWRGPDGIVHWRHGSAAMGHCMLHTTAESMESAQPLVSADGDLVVAMDGYIANYHELRSALLARGARLRSGADAELVLHAYDQWGEDCPAHIDGEYAFVVWDGRLRQPFCARDHDGLRPLFYHWDGVTLVLASEMAALLAALPARPPLNHAYLAEAMTEGWYSLNQTVWDGVLRVPAAHSMVLAAGRLRLREYWQLTVEVSITYARDEDYFDHYRQVHAQCVQQASRTHRPLAFEVSGGLDSSSLVCMADHLRRQGQLPAPEIRGYTLAGEAGSATDELEFARAVGDHIGLAITPVPLFLPGLDWFTTHVERLQDMPPYPNGAMAVGLERRAAADGCRVCINGLGGDQWLDGNANNYAEQLLARDWAGLRASLAEDMADFGPVAAGRMLVRHGLRPFVPAPVKAGLRHARAAIRRDPEDGFYWIAPDMRRELARRRRDYMAGLPMGGVWVYKHWKLKTAFMAMAHDVQARQHALEGMEQRSPMYSRAFIEFSAATPERMRRRGKINRYIHRRALAGIMPDKVANRTGKAEFSSAVTANDAALQRFFACSAPDSGALSTESKGIARFLATYRNAAIDEKPTWALWGIYAYAALLMLQTKSQG